MQTTFKDRISLSHLDPFCSERFGYVRTPSSQSTAGAWHHRSYVKELKASLSLPAFQKCNINRKFLEHQSLYQSAVLQRFPIHQVLCHAVCIKIYVSIELKTCLGLADSFKNLRLLSAGVLGGLAASYFDILKTPINARGDPCPASTAPPAAETVMGTPAPLHSGDVLPKVLPLAP